MLARCLSASLLGFDAIPVTVEVDLAPGLPGQWLTSVPVTRCPLRIWPLPFVSEVSMLLSHGADQGPDNTRLNWSSS
nr:hypothetical protein [Synechococcus sp. GEYO]